MSWELDAVRAARWGWTFPKGAGAAPHYLRCEHFNEKGQRCLLANGHASEHTAPDEVKQALPKSSPKRSASDETPVDASP